MLWLLYPQGNSPQYPLDRRLGGPKSQSGYGGEEKNYLHCTVHKTTNFPVIFFMDVIRGLSH